MKKEMQLLERIVEIYDSYAYPGYPFSITGYADLAQEKGYVQNKKFISWEEFCDIFDSILCYHLVDCLKTTKGSWAVDAYMPNYKEFFNMENEEFEIGNYELAKLYFATYSAIREFKGQEKFLFFYYDGESEYFTVEVFSSLEEIEKFKEDYFPEPEEE